MDGADELTVRTSEAAEAVAVVVHRVHGVELAKAVAGSRNLSAAEESRRLVGSI